MDEREALVAIGFPASVAVLPLNVPGKRLLAVTFALDRRIATKAEVCDVVVIVEKCATAAEFAQRARDAAFPGLVELVTTLRLKVGDAKIEATVQGE